MYEGLTIVQYDRGNLGEFICLSAYKKIFGVDVYFERRKNNLGWYFMNIDGSLDSMLYDYHRTKVESVTIQKYVFGSCVYENLLSGNYDEARKILHAMINYRKSNPDCAPESLIPFDLPDPDYSYDSSKKVLTRIHNFDNIDLSLAFPGSEIINVYCRPEKRWIFKFLYMYKKHQDSLLNNTQRFSKGFDEFWNYNWSKNLTVKEGAVNIDCYDVFLGNTGSYFGSDFSADFADNFNGNKSMLESYGLDHTRDNVTSDELLAIIKTIYSDYLN